MLIKNYKTKIKKFLPLNIPRINKNYLIGLIDSHIIHYPAPLSLTYAWSFGSLAGITLVIQIISGLFLSMFYTAHINYAFDSIEFIMRSVNYGWFVRYIHANGASMFFIVLYAHMCRGLYYGSYMSPRETLWSSGVILYLLAMATAFTGYVLPWGQMSFWGATVITSMVTAIPIAGQYIAEWLWGGYVIRNPTLKRFYTIHFLLPFIIAAITIIHLALLHQSGSTSPIGSDAGIDDIPFYPYFFWKDFFAFTIYIFIFGFLIFYYPNLLNHPDNCIRANPIKTPLHVVPEWYFLPFYAILRSIPHKAGGIVTMFASVLVLFAVPYLNTSLIRNTTYRPIFKIFFWLFVADFLSLMYLGQRPVIDKLVVIGQYETLVYFLFFIVILPISGKLETFLATYDVHSFVKKHKKIKI